MSRDQLALSLNLGIFRTDHGNIISTSSVTKLVDRNVHAKTAPQSLLNKFTEINTKHHYNTRLSAKKCFSVKFSRTEKMKKSFTRIGVSIWNSIPLSVKTLNVSNFRKKN